MDNLDNYPIYENEYYDEPENKFIFGKIINETEKAIKFQMINIKPFWLPKSQVKTAYNGTDVRVELPQWLLDKLPSFAKENSYSLSDVQKFIQGILF